MMKTNVIFGQTIYGKCLPTEKKDSLRTLGTTVITTSMLANLLKCNENKN